MYSKTPTHNTEDDWDDGPSTTTTTSSIRPNTYNKPYNNNDNRSNNFDRNKSPGANRYNNVTIS